MKNTKEYNQEYYKKNKEKMDAQAKEWAKAHSEQKKESNRRYRNNHKSKYDSEYFREYYKKNKERYKSQQKENYINHKEEYSARNKRWRAENEEKAKETGAKWREENKEKRVAQRKEYYQKNSEKIVQKVIYWQKENKGRVNAKNKARKLLKKSRIPRCADMVKIKEIYIEADRRTRETGIRHEVDHIVPLQGKMVNGFHVHWNLQILTKEENASKSNTYYPGCME